MTGVGWPGQSGVTVTPSDLRMVVIRCFASCIGGRVDGVSIHAVVDAKEVGMFRGTPSAITGACFQPVAG
ncbi:hypothetical protein ACQ86N_21335 [Puia sp. P3]|uniref:hypothetical protein n=1 Tax=Puia sp. P3 TaxID=3423952 RepID=UPI003D667A6E